MTEKTTGASGGRWMFWLGCLLLAAFAGLAGYTYFNRDKAFQDEDELALLAKSLGKSGSASGATSEGWPQWRGPMRDGKSAEKGLLLDWSASEPPRLWEARIGDGFGGIVATGGRVYTMFQDGDREVIGCWDARTGAELWRHAYQARFEDKFGTGPRGTPTIHGDQVFAVGGTGIVHCLDARNKGKEIWSKDLKTLFGVGVPTWGFAFSPLVVGDLVFVCPGGTADNAVAALDRATGAVRWQRLDLGGGYSSPMLAELGGERQVLFFAGAGLVSLVPETGKELWRFPWETSYQANIATPIVFQNYVFISAGYGQGCALLRIERPPGGDFEVKRVYQHLRLSNHFSSSIYHDGYLFGFNESTLVCMDVRDGKGKAKWSERDFERGSLLLVDGHLIILGENGRLAVAVATPAGYVEKGRMDIFKGPLCWSAPALADGRLFVRDRQRLVCLDLRK